MGRLVFIRHAQASYGTGNYDQLSALGYHQAQLLGQHLAESDCQFDSVYVGPSKRHQQTLDEVRVIYDGKNLPFPDPIRMDALGEHRGAEVLRHLLPDLVQCDRQIRHWSEEAQLDESVKRRNHLRTFEYFMPRWAGGRLNVAHPTDFEDWPAFRERVKSGVEEILHHKTNGQVIGVFTSGGTMSAAVGYSLDMTNDEQIAALNTVVHNTSITEFLFSQKRLTLTAFNQVPHLKSNEKTLV